MKDKLDEHEAKEGKDFHLSFVIPCLNEEKSIRQTLLDIQQNVPSELTYQIIVVDNGSVDQTVAFAEELGARVLIHPEVLVSELRNIGVSNSMGEIIIFIDADISLTEDWKDHILDYYELALANDAVYGSNCGPEGNEGILNTYWYSPMAATVKKTYVATGHMIVSKSNFEKIGGFNPKLKTGEDYEFSQRAKALGFLLENIPELKVVHRGFPKTIIQFFEREAWHGKGDLYSIKTAFTSKVFLAAMTFMFVHLVLVASLAFQNILSITISLSLIFGIPVFFSFYKFPDLKVHQRPTNILINSIYLYGRIFSIFYLKRKWRK